jgi:hypothetical protein
LQFVFVGSNLFSTSEFESKITLETTAPFYGRYYTIVIEKCSAFLLDDLNNSKMEDHPIALSFINSIIKNSLRNSQLRQIGRNPRFFMPARAKVFQSQVETWPGFFTSSWIFQRGLYLIIDNISKFLSVDNCLSLIQDRLQRYDANFVNREFEGAIVMAKYGPHRTYKVHQIKWAMNPKDYIFDHGDEKARTNMIDYFLTAYSVKIHSVNQPLFEIRQKRQNIYLPPELCTLVGIPAKIRENKKVMADIRQSLFQKPHERIGSIKELNRMISDSKEVKEWNLDINLEPDTIEAKVLKRPQIYQPSNGFNEKGQPSSGGQITARPLDDTKILGTIVHQPIHFRKWAIFCLEKDVHHGEYLNDRFYELSQERRFEIYVDYGDIVELSNKSGIEAFKEAIDDYYLKYVCGKDANGKQMKKPKKTKDLYFFLIIMPDSIKQEHLYTALKNKINTDSPVISQFVSSKTI